MSRDSASWQATAAHSAAFAWRRRRAVCTSTFHGQRLNDKQGKQCQFLSLPSEGHVWNWVLRAIVRNPQIVIRNSFRKLQLPLSNCATTIAYGSLTLTEKIHARLNHAACACGSETCAQNRDRSRRMTDDETALSWTSTDDGCETALSYGHLRNCKIIVIDHRVLVARTKTFTAKNRCSVFWWKHLL